MKKNEIQEALKAIMSKGDGDTGKVSELVLKLVETVNKQEKAAGAKRRMEAARRKEFNRIPLAKNLSYEQMTSYVWDYAVSDIGKFKDWMAANHPEVIVGISGEVSNV